MNAKEFRFCVCEATGERSTVWKIWVNKSDIYILTRMMGSDAKISLHASGHCQFSMTSKWWVNHSEDVVQKKDRHIVHWKLPEISNGQTAHVFRIIIPRSELREINVEENLKKVHWLPIPVRNHATLIECYLTQPLKQEPSTLNSPYQHLVSMPLVDGRWFVVFIQEVEMNKDRLLKLENARNEILSIMSEKNISIQPNQRAVGFLDIKDCKGLIELTPLKRVCQREDKESNFYN
jgi:hypothetical protein